MATAFSPSRRPTGATASLTIGSFVVIPSSRCLEAELARAASILRCRAMPRMVGDGCAHSFARTFGGHGDNLASARRGRMGYSTAKMDDATMRDGGGAAPL